MKKTNKYWNTSRPAIKERNNPKRTKTSNKKVQ